LAQKYFKDISFFPFQSLRTLIQGRHGVTWTLGTSMEVTELITNYTDELLEQGLIDKIISEPFSMSCLLIL
jgi:hypothetical protein